MKFSSILTPVHQGHQQLVRSAECGWPALVTMPFAVAMSNVGAAATGDITVTANTGSAFLPVSVTIQETNPGTGEIIGDHILNNLGAGENRTVAVFVTFNGCVSFDPAANRIFIEFRDASNNVVGSTSTAVSTNR